MDTLLRTLMGPWTTYIAWLLGKHGRLRFGELKAQAPASSAEVLTERLRHLEASGLVDRDHQPTIPPPSTTPSSRAVWNCTPCSTA
jgi:DNA-binding HxlR family transcriptional regulator